MNIELLNHTHKDAVRGLFISPKYMGSILNDEYFFDYKDSEKFQKTTYDVFCDTYLSDLRNFKAYGVIINGEVVSYVSSYESTEAAEWYGTGVRSRKSSTIKYSLDATINYYESRGKFKFYSMFNVKHEPLYRRLAFSKHTSERYDYVNEYVVPARTKCIYLNAWQILFHRTLMPVDCLVRSAWLKPEYRHKDLPVAGFI